MSGWYADDMTYCGACQECREGNERWCRSPVPKDPVAYEQQLKIVDEVMKEIIEEEKLDEALDKLW